MLVLWKLTNYASKAFSSSTVDRHSKRSKPFNTNWNCGDN